MQGMELSIYAIADLGNRFRQLGKCSNCPLYPKCKGIGLHHNPNDNPKNPNKNPDNPCKDCKIKKEK